jgi:hypothetical protein
VCSISAFASYALPVDYYVPTSVEFVPQSSILDMTTKTFLVNNLLTVWPSVTSLKCHITKQRLDLWKFLNAHAECDNHTEPPFISVIGSPGIGKSVIVYAWTIWHAMKFKKRTLYVQGINFFQFELISIIDNKVLRFSIEDEVDAEHKVHHLVNNLYKENCYDLIVCHRKQT